MVIYLRYIVFGLTVYLFLHGWQPYRLQAQSVLTAIHQGSLDQLLHEGQQASDPYQSRFFRVRGIPYLTVKTPSGNIEVVHNPGIDGIQVDLYVDRGFTFWPGSRRLDDFRVLLQQQGDHIVASVEDRGGRAGRVSPIEFSFVVQVPRQISADLRTMKGNIILEGVEGEHYLQTHTTGNITVSRASGEIQVAALNGHIDLEDLSGTIFAKNTNGGIRASKSSGEIRLRTTNGHITADHISGTLISATTNGNIIAAFDEVLEGIFMETVTGNIDLEMPSWPGYTIESRGQRFEISGFNQSILSREIQNNRRGTVVIRDGSLPVQLTTTLGRISIKESH